MLREPLAYHFAAWRDKHAANTRVGVGNKKRLGGEPKRLVDVGGRFMNHGAQDGSLVAICSSTLRQWSLNPD